MEATVFTDDQLQRLYPDGIENHYLNHARNAIIHRFLKKNRLHEKHILEIGSGRGVVVRYLNDRGLFCIGVEQAAVIPVTGIDHVFYPQTDAFDLAAELKRTISVVMLLDVIEHIEEPTQFMEKITQYFPAMKYFLVTVPAGQELWTNYDEFNGHYRR
jgi:2-polyprenyl-3-methyl-5-hydroxy-6-metoxy-1,4-benzoquinol methylase